MFTQIGIPGTIGFKAATKLADKALKAKKAGTYANLKAKNVTLAAAKADELNKASKTKKICSGCIWWCNRRNICCRCRRDRYLW